MAEGRRFWWKRLLSRESLDPLPCVKVNAGVGGLLSAVGLLVLVMRAFGEDDPFGNIPYAQLGAGLFFLLGAGAAWLLPSARSSLLATQGLGFVALVGAYVAGMWYALNVLMPAGRLDGFGHAPGILAFATAYGVRLLLDFGRFVADRGKVLLATCGGLVVGALCDLVLLYWMFAWFAQHMSGMLNHG